MAINSGANECNSTNNYHEIICEMKDFYKVKKQHRKKNKQFCLHWYRMESS